MIILSIYVCCFALKQENHIYTKPKKETEIFTIWHIETFEGGGKARIDYLKAVAKHLEKQNPNTLFFVKNVSPEDLENELLINTPDILSFGFGVGKIILPYLTKLCNTFNVRDSLIESGMFNNYLYALPYIVSGYAEIKHNAQSSEIHFGTSDYINPEHLGYKAIKQETAYEAYKDFVYNHKSTLIGTGRDVYRINNLNNVGRTNALITPISTYTDLIQYIGLVTNNTITNNFLSLTLSQNFQTTLTTYSLFSSLNNKLYFSGIYNDMENALFNCTIAKVFDE